MDRGPNKHPIRPKSTCEGAELLMIYQPPTIIIPGFAQDKVYGPTILDLFRRRCCRFTANHLVRKTHGAGQKFISERAAGHECLLETRGAAKDRSVQSARCI